MHNSLIALEWVWSQLPVQGASTGCMLEYVHPQQRPGLYCNSSKHLPTVSHPRAQQLDVPVPLMATAAHSMTLSSLWTLAAHPDLIDPSTAPTLRSCISLPGAGRSSPACGWPEDCAEPGAAAWCRLSRRLQPGWQVMATMGSASGTGTLSTTATQVLRLHSFGPCVGPWLDCS